MTKNEAKKVIKCAAEGNCGDCPRLDDCTNDCEQNVHAAAKVLYGGHETNEVVKLAKKLIFEWIRVGGDVSVVEVDGAFKIAKYFLKKASKINE